MVVILAAGMMVCIAGALFLITFPVYAWASNGVRKIERSVALVLDELFVFDITARSITWMVTVLVVFCVLILGVGLKSIIGAIFGILIGVIVPSGIILLVVRRRRQRLENQLVTGLITLANGMRAGLNLGQAIGLIEQHSTKPLSQEFGLVMREIEHGTSIDVALDRASQRIKSHNFRLLFAALKTTRKRGGDIPETLDRLNESLREIIRLEEKVKALTAQGRTSAIGMALMPIVVLAIYYLIDTEGTTLLFTNSYGHLVLFIVGVLDLLGFMWIRKIISFEI